MKELIIYAICCVAVTVFIYIGYRLPPKKTKNTKKKKEKSEEIRKNVLYGIE